ncbi:hypothetical protein JHK85_025944 [Glycine max]|nr:hypothetical protein JHK85_025944 [Glycine max]
MRKKLLIETTKGLSFCSNRNFTPKPNHCNFLPSHYLLPLLCFSNRLYSVSYEVCFSVDPLKVQQCGWSHAASVPSEEPEAPKGQKRVPRHERRAMSNHCIAPESNTVEKFSKEPCPSSLDMPNDIKTEEVVSTYSDSFAPEHSQEERKHSPLFSENDGTGYDKAQGHEYDFVNMENHQNVEEKCIKKADCERREQPDLEDLSRELLHSSLLEPNDVKSREAVSNSSDSVTQERHPLKEEIDQFSASFIEKSVSSCSEGQSHDSKFVDMEKHSAFVKKSFEKRYERKDQDAVDSLKHKIEQSQRSLEYDESKMNSSNKRETSVVVGSQKSTLWGNLKSFATGIINIWKKS